MRTTRLTTACSAAVALLGASVAAAQPCAPSKQRSSQKWVEPRPPDFIFEQALELAAELGYVSIEVDSLPRRELRAQQRDWPPIPMLSQWRALPYPGTRIRFSVEPLDDWARIEAEIQLLCGFSATPPDGWEQDLQAEALILHHVLGDYATLLGMKLRAIREVPGRSCAPLREGHPKIRTCRDIARRYPDDPDAHLQYALALIRFFHAKQARSPIRQLFELAGERLDLFLTLGGAMLEEDEYGEAERLFRRAAALWPDSPMVHVQLGIALARRGKQKDALGPLERGIQLGTAEPEAFYQAARSARRAKREDAARAYLERALELYRSVLRERKDDVRTWASMGLAASMLERHAEAMSYFERAFHVDLTYLGRDAELREAVERSLAAAGPQPAAPLPQ